MDNLFYCQDCQHPFSVPQGKLQQYCPACRHKRHSETGKIHGGDWNRKTKPALNHDQAIAKVQEAMKTEGTP